MSSGENDLVESDDWQHASPADEDWSDATPLCPRCASEVTILDHYCNRCGFAVGKFTPYIPFVNIRFICEPFAIMWQRLWQPRGETAARRMVYLLLLVVAAIVSGAWPILLLAAILWWVRPPKIEGLCEACGYDMRATLSRCPECGLPAPASSTPSMDEQ